MGNFSAHVQRGRMKEERLANMEQYIREHRSVSLDTLCKVFEVSKNTVRRDVAHIVERSDLRKIYGGVSAPYNRIPPSFSERATLNIEAKQRIGKRAASLVSDGDIIFIDSGTTTCQIIDFLATRNNLTVITHSLDVINRASAFPNITLICLSGILNRMTQSFTGQSTIENLQDLNISKAFMAANGVSLKNGASQSTPIEFAIKKTVVSRSDDVYVLIENKKFGAVSMLSYCKIEDITSIITEKIPSEEYRQAFSAMGRPILVAD